MLSVFVFGPGATGIRRLVLLGENSWYFLGMGINCHIHVYYYFHYVSYAT